MIQKKFLKIGLSNLTDERVTLSIDFHPAFSHIGNKTREFINILHALDDVTQFFTEPPQVNFQRPKNLKDELVGRLEIGVLIKGV